MSTDEGVPHVYSLTALTGRRRNENRRTVIATVEVRRGAFIIAVGSFLAGLIPTAILAPMLGAWSVIIPMLAIAAGLWMFDMRQTRGLRLTNYQAIADSKKVRNGVLYASGAPITAPPLVMHQKVVLLSGPAHAAPPADGASRKPNAASRRRNRSAREALFT